MKRDGGKTTTFRLLQTDGLNIPPKEKNSLRVLRDSFFAQVRFLPIGFACHFCSTSRSRVKQC